MESTGHLLRLQRRSHPLTRAWALCARGLQRWDLCLSALLHRETAGLRRIPQSRRRSAFYPLRTGSTLMRVALVGLVCIHVCHPFAPEFIGCLRLACEAYHLPKHVSKHVELVTPTVHFDTKFTRRGPQSRAVRARTGLNSGQPRRGTVLPKTVGKVNHKELAANEEPTDCDR